MATPRPQQLIVEGKDDLYSILHLLRRTGVLQKEATEQSSPIEIIPVNSKRRLIDDIRTRWKQAGVKSIGYVLDADDAASELKGVVPTWDAIRHRLTQIPVDSETSISIHGFTGQVGTEGPRIGIWIMPDNQRDGAIEDFLISLIDPLDLLFRFASEKTAEAGNLAVDDKFRDSDFGKAVLSCWLAWCDDPGKPYGHAMLAGRFSVSTEPATRFIDWIRKLYIL